MKIQTISDVPDSTYFTMSDVEPVYTGNVFCPATRNLQLVNGAAQTVALRDTVFAECLARHGGRAFYSIA